MSAFYDCIVSNSAKEISDVLGNWHEIPDNKTQRQWVCTIPNEKIKFYIYDYKAYRHIELNEIYDYHIGANSLNESKLVVKYLRSLGLDAYYDV